MTAQLELLTKKYKGRYVRLYLTTSEFVEGILVGTWNQNWIVFGPAFKQAFGSRQQELRYIPVQKIKMLLPLKLLGEKQAICGWLYSSVN